MTAEEYIKLLNKQKKKAEERFTNLTQLQSQLIEVGFSWLLDNLDLKGGRFATPADLPKLMDDFVLTIVSTTADNKQYKKALSDYLHDIDVINSNIEKYHQTFNRISIKTPGVKEVQKAVVGEIINQYTENGLNVHFAAPLRDLIFSNILGGMSQKDAMQYLKDYIVGGKDDSGKLGRYLEQTAQQGVDSYTGAINMKLQDEFKFTGYIISGSLIETSSKQCRMAVTQSRNGYLTFAEWEKILQVARENSKAGLIDKTTVKNLPLNKLHWGCRHEFTPVKK